MNKLLFLCTYEGWYKAEHFFKIYFYLFLAALGLHCCAGAFSSCFERGLLLLWSMGSRRVGFSSCGSWALECRLSSCGAWAQLLRGMWDLPRPGLEHVSLALADGFLTTAPPGKPMQNILKPALLIVNILSFQYIQTHLIVFIFIYLYLLYFIFKIITYFIYLFLAVLGLCCCARAFSSCSEWGLLFIAVLGLLIVVASLLVEHGLQACRLQQLWHKGSVLVAHGLQSAGSVVVAHGLSCSAACGIFPGQGSNLCPLHWQADS